MPCQRLRLFRSVLICVLSNVGALQVAWAQSTRAKQPVCRRVEQSQKRWSDQVIRGWAGEYTIYVIATTGRYSADSMAQGGLSLWVTEPAYAQDKPVRGRRARTYPLSGATDVPLARLAPVSIAIPLSSRDPARPGVQINEGRSMVLGGHYGPQFFTMDAGVLFEIDSADAMGFRGRWVEGGRRGLHGEIPAGYFCAFRTRPPST
jgi:hypothetical protein